MPPPNRAGLNSEVEAVDPPRSMNSHEMELPRRILVGHGVASELGRFMDSLGLGGSVLLVSGTHVRRRVEGIVAGSLRGWEPEPVWMEVSVPTLEEVERVRGEAVKSRADVIVGIGGGKGVDVAKLVAFKTGKPFISVPTSASHDGIASPFTSLTGMDKPYSVRSRTPLGVLADIDVIADAPARLLASGCGDLVAKFTAVKDWELARDEKSEYYGEYAASLALLSAQVVTRRAEAIGKHEPDSVRGVVEALISAGVAAGIAGSSRPLSGSEHLFSHALSIVAPGAGLHGEKCGVGTIMVSRLQDDDWGRISDALEKIHAPRTARQLGISAEQVTDALIMAPKVRPERYTILHKRSLDRDAAVKLATETGVI